LLYGFVDPVLLYVANHDFGAFARKFDCCGLPDAPAGASDDGYLVFESHVLPLVLTAAVGSCGAQFSPFWRDAQ
jgi:hypothetical protein